MREQRRALGRQIAALMQARQADVSAVAEALSTDEKRIQRLCDGRAIISAGDGYRLAQFLGVEVGDLASPEPKLPPPLPTGFRDIQRIEMALRRVRMLELQRILLALLQRLTEN